MIFHFVLHVDVLYYKCSVLFAPAPGHQGMKDIDELLNFIGDNPPNSKNNHGASAGGTKATSKNGPTRGKAALNGPSCVVSPTKEPPPIVKDKDVVGGVAKKQRKKKNNGGSAAGGLQLPSQQLQQETGGDVVGKRQQQQDASGSQADNSSDNGSSVADMKEVTVMSSSDTAAAGGSVVDGDGNKPSSADTATAINNKSTLSSPRRQLKSSRDDRVMKTRSSSFGESSTTTIVSNRMTSAALDDADYIFTDFELPRAPQEAEFQTVASKKKKRHHGGAGSGGAPSMMTGSESFDSAMQHFYTGSGGQQQHRESRPFYRPRDCFNNDFYHRSTGFDRRSPFSSSSAAPPHRPVRAYTPPPSSSRDSECDASVRSSVGYHGGATSAGSGRSFSPCAFPVLARSGRRASTGTAECDAGALAANAAESSDAESSVSVPSGERGSKHRPSSDTAASSSSTGSSEHANLNLPFSYAKAVRVVGRPTTDDALVPFSKTVDSPDERDKASPAAGVGTSGTGMGERRHSLGNINMLDMPPLEALQSGQNVSHAHHRSQELAQTSRDVTATTSASRGNDSHSASMCSTQASSKYSSAENITAPTPSAKDTAIADPSAIAADTGPTNLVGAATNVSNENNREAPALTAATGAQAVANNTKTHYVPNPQSHADFPQLPGSHPVSDNKKIAGSVTASAAVVAPKAVNSQQQLTAASVVSSHRNNPTTSSVSLTHKPQHQQQSQPNIIATKASWLPCSKPTAANVVSVAPVTTKIVSVGVSTQQQPPYANGAPSFVGSKQSHNNSGIALSGHTARASSQQQPSSANGLGNKYPMAAAAAGANVRTVHPSYYSTPKVKPPSHTADFGVKTTSAAADIDNIITPSSSSTTSSVVFLDKKFETKGGDIGISFGFDDSLLETNLDDDTKLMTTQQQRHSNGDGESLSSPENYSPVLTCYNSTHRSHDDSSHRHHISVDSGVMMTSSLSATLDTGSPAGASAAAVLAAEDVSDNRATSSSDYGSITTTVNTNQQQKNYVINTSSAQQQQQQQQPLNGLTFEVSVKVKAVAVNDGEPLTCFSPSLQLTNSGSVGGASEPILNNAAGTSTGDSSSSSRSIVQVPLLSSSSSTKTATNSVCASSSQLSSTALDNDVVTPSFLEKNVDVGDDDDATPVKFYLPSRDDDPNFDVGSFDHERAVQLLFDGELAADVRRRSLLTSTRDFSLKMPFLLFCFVYCIYMYLQLGKCCILYPGLTVLYGFTYQLETCSKP